MLKKIIAYLICGITVFSFSACSKEASEVPAEDSLTQISEPANTIQSEPIHTHFGSGKWSGDSEMHWRFCSCGKRTDVGPHAFDKKSSCTECGYQTIIAPAPDVNSEPLQLYTNEADGYSLLLPPDFKVDSSLSEIVTVFENEDTRIEIYKQILSTFSASTYRSFSNRFLKNAVDHTSSYRGYKIVCGKNVYVTQWQRDALKRLENDKNHYVSYDIANGNYVYTIFVKSSSPVAYEDFDYIFESLSFFTPTAEHGVWKSEMQDLETRGWNDETAAFYEEYFGESAGLSWGLFDPEAAYGDTTEIEYYEKELNYKFPVILSYFGLSEKSYSKLKDTLEGSWANGNVLELTVQTYATAEGGNMTYDILNGEYDDVLEYYARTIRNFGHPVLFRLMNEMNGDWCPYSAYHTSRDTLIYKEAYRYVYGIFQRAGADNVIWIWNPNESSFPDFDWNNALMYYPGDEYVDIIGLTAYNTGNYYSSYGEKWQSFSKLYDKLYADYCAHFSQPFMITEFACAKKGGNKIAWVEDMFESLGSYEGIKMAVWWNSVDLDKYGNMARNYLIDDPIEVLDVFKKNIK